MAERMVGRVSRTESETRELCIRLFFIGFLRSETVILDRPRHEVGGEDMSENDGIAKVIEGYRHFSEEIYPGASRALRAAQE